MAEKRNSPYIWVTWLSKLISGEQQCEFAAWYKAHYKSEKSSSNGFSLVAWTIKHNQLLHKQRDGLKQQGDTVMIEDQNSFKFDLPGDILISGKPDIVSLPGPVSSIKEKGLVIDCKTGRPKNSDLVQVMLYMMFLPKAIERYENMVFDGLVVYPNSEVPISWTEIDEELKRTVWELIKRIGGDTPCEMIPSNNECRWCDISKANCLKRIE